MAKTQETFGTRIAALVDRSGLSQAEFALAIGIGRDMLNRWIRDRIETTPRRANLRSVADLFNYDVGAMVDHLENGTPLPRPVQARRINVPKGATPAEIRHAAAAHRSHRFVTADDLHIDANEMLPVVNRVSSGKRRASTDLGHAEYTTSDWVRRGLPPEARAMIVDGDSMQPDYEPGDIIVCDPTMDAQNGQPHIVQLGPAHDDENCFRVLHFLDEDGEPSDDVENAPLVELRAINSAWPSRRIRREDIAYAWPATELRRKINPQKARNG